jgi:PAS domain S-box-containing protein
VPISRLAESTESIERPPSSGGAAPGAAPSADEALRQIVEGTAAATGAEFFRALVRHLAGALGMRFAFVGELLRPENGRPPGERVRVLAVWAGDQFADNFEYDLRGTPCENVVGHDLCEYPRGVAALFPRDGMLLQMGVESYLAAPLFDVGREPLGLLAVMHDRPTDGDAAVPHAREVLRIFAARAAAELARLRREEALRANERLYHSLAEHSGVGIWQLSMPGGHTLYMNPAMRRLMELEEGQGVDGMTYHRFLTPESLERMNAELAKRREGIASQYELDLVGMRGGTRRALVSGAPVMGPDGRLQSIVGTFTDISTRRDTEQALRDTATRLRLLTQQVPAVLWTTDTELRVTSGMGAGLRALGYSQDEFKGTSLLRQRDPGEGDPSELIAAHRRALAGESVGYEQKWRGHWFQAHVEPLRADDGTITGVIGISLDVTERKRAEEELRDARDWLEFRVEERTRELQRANRALQHEVDGRRRIEEELRQSQARYASILNSQQTLIARSDMHGRTTYVNAAHQRMFGSQVGDSVYFKVHPDDVEATRRAMEDLARPPHTCALEQRVEVAGKWRTILWQAGVIRDRSGQIVEYQAVGFDITERKRAEEMLRESERRAKQSANQARGAVRQTQEALDEAREVAEFNRRLAQEVDHRVRNNLAGLMSLVQAMKTAAKPDAKAFASAIEGRLLAMTHVNRLLAEANWQEVELKTLVASLLEAVKRLGSYPIPALIDGPAVPISPRQASPVAMILLEWFTNSSKYGAHSVPGGKLMVVWAIDRSTRPPRVRLHWTETGGPPIRKETKPSLGTELVEAFATLELRGHLQLRYPEEGADHELDFPLGEVKGA